MEDIMEQIVRIDSQACENKSKYEELLNRKKNEYDLKIVTYRNQKIALAKQNADNIYKSIEETIEKDEASKKEKINKAVNEINIRYSKIEQELIENIFEKFFIAEG